MLQRGWMESLGASGRVFGDWPGAGSILYPKIAVPVACSRAGWGQSAIPCSEGPPEGPWGQAGPGGVLLCVTTFSLLGSC